jgi:hypothetical protein
LRPDGANISRDPISKINRAKLTRGVAQVVEGLLCKHEVLRSNSSLTKKKKKKSIKMLGPVNKLERNNYYFQARFFVHYLLIHPFK